MKQRQTTEVVSIRLERRLVAELRKQALTERVNLSDYIRDKLFEALAGQEIRTDLAEMRTLIEEVAADLSELKADVQAIRMQFMD